MRTAQLVWNSRGFSQGDFMSFSVLTDATHWYKRLPLIFTTLQELRRAQISECRNNEDKAIKRKPLFSFDFLSCCLSIAAIAGGLSLPRTPVLLVGRLGHRCPAQAEQTHTNDEDHLTHRLISFTFEVVDIDRTMLLFCRCSELVQLPFDGPDPRGRWTSCCCSESAA